MEAPENQVAPEKKTLDDSFKLLVREEVEKEVEKRIARQEWFYWKFLGGFVIAAGLIAFAFWQVEISKIPAEVEKQLAEKEVINAKDRIMEIKSSVENANQSVNFAATAVSNAMFIVEGNCQAFTNRLNDLIKQDGILLNKDFSKFFVNQTITNFDGQRFLLDYEPIPFTLEFHCYDKEFEGDLNRMEGFHIDGKAIVCDVNYYRTNLFYRGFLSQNGLKVKYVSKSIR